MEMYLKHYDNFAEVKETLNEAITGVEWLLTLISYDFLYEEKEQKEIITKVISLIEKAREILKKEQ